MPAGNCGPRSVKPAENTEERPEITSGLSSFSLRVILRRVEHVVKNWCGSNILITILLYIFLIASC